MACDSIMDISLTLNIDDISAMQDDVSMDVSSAPTPQLEYTINSNRTLGPSPATNDDINNLKMTWSSMPDVKAILEKKRRSLQAAYDMQKSLEKELTKAEMKFEARKKAQAEEVNKLKSEEEKVKHSEAKLAMVHTKLKSLLKEAEELKSLKMNTQNENVVDKSKLDAYRQVTGITFSGLNINSPNLLKGYISKRSSSADLKTFSLNTNEHSAAFIRDFVWQVMDDMHEKNWENVGQPATGVAPLSSTDSDLTGC